MDATDISVVSAIPSAARIEFLSSMRARADTMTAAGKADAKMIVTFTSADRGSQLTITNISIGRRNILRTDIIVRLLFFIILPILLSPSCIPTTSIDSGTVTSPMSVTLSNKREGSLRPMNSIITLTIETIVEGLQNVLRSLLALKLPLPELMLKIKGPAEYIYNVRQILFRIIRYNISFPKMALVMGNPMKPLLTVEKIIMYTPRSSEGLTLSIFLHKKYPVIKVIAKSPTPQAKTSAVTLAVSELNSLDVTDERIIQGVVIITSRSTKNFVALLGMIFALLMTKPAAIIKKIDVVFDKITAIK